MYNCLESINSLYVEKKDKGYVSTPCCLFKHKGKHIVKNIDDLLPKKIPKIFLNLRIL